MTITTSAEHNTQVIRRYFDEVWTQGQLEVLDELIHPDYVNHNPSTPNPAQGPAGLKPIVAAMREAFPDLRYRIDHLLVSGDHVTVRLTVNGTHRGDFFGLPPTFRTFEVAQMNIERLEAGKIREHWRVTDELSLLRQLGLSG